jgi:hypothetical protein
MCYNTSYMGESDRRGGSAAYQEAMTRARHDVSARQLAEYNIEKAHQNRAPVVVFDASGLGGGR